MPLHWHRIQVYLVIVKDTESENGLAYYEFTYKTTKAAGKPVDIFLKKCLILVANIRNRR